MQVTFLNKLTSPVRFFAAGTSAVLFLGLTLLSGALAGAQQHVVVSGTPVQLGALTGGGWDGSQEPVGGTFVVGVNGNVLVGAGYSSNFLQLTLAGSDTILASGVGASNAALDSYGNLYFGGNYNANVFKVPYNATTGAYVGWSSAAPTANCQGGNLDTTACVFAPAVSTLMNSIASSNGTGFAGVAFDGQGNFFFESNTLPSTANTIYECNLACISNSSATPAKIYADSATVGALAIDPWGNIFFVDGNNSGGKVTNLNEIKLSSGTYASSPTVVLSYTNAAGYSNGISGLAISGNGTIYISTNGDGIFGIPNTQSGGPSVSGMYLISTQGGKGVAVDAAGNVYGIPYNGGDVVSYIPVGNFSLGTEPVSTAATAVSGTIFDSGGACTPTIAASVTRFGKTSTEFTATPGTTCSTAFGGTNGVFSAGPLTAAGFASFPVTLNFTPSAAGGRNATLTIADSTNSVSGVAALTGIGVAALANVDPGVVTSYTTGLTKPTSVIADALGDVFVADSGAGKVYEIPSGSTTPAAVGSGFTAPSALAFDSNGNLYVADNGVPDVVEIANTGTTGGFVAGTQTTIISSTATFDGTALKDAEALAVGPQGTLYISDTGNERVVFWNSVSGQSGVTLASAANGLKNPMGLAVDASADLYVADSTLNQVVIVSSAGAVSTVTLPSSVTEAVGVAVEPSGSIIVADSASANIVRVPYLSGAFSAANAVTIDTISPSSSSLWMNNAGDLYVAAGGVSANTILRDSTSGAAINLGIVADGANNSGNVYFMDSGNAAATLADVSGSDVTQPTSYPTFQLNVPGTGGCSAGLSTSSSGNLCAFTAEFAPPAGTTAGPYSATADILVGTPALTVPVAISGTASASAAQAQTITFTPPATGYEGQVLTLSATATSGLAVVFTTSTSSVCTLSGTNGTTATFVATGTCTIFANQAGGSVSGTLYGAAPQVTKNITISTLTASGVPSLLLTQFNWIWPLSSGGFTDGQNPAGGSFAVTQDGQVVLGNSYGNTVYFVSATTGVMNQSVAFNGPGGIAIDSNNNLYFSHLYTSAVYKLPYLGKGTYAALADCTLTPDPCAAAPPACQGGTADTAECTFANSGQNTKAIAFDPSGNFYEVTEPATTASGASAIYECSTSCQPAGTGTLLYSDTNGISQIAFDPWGNLFFTDANYLEGSSNNESNSGASSSALNELAYSSTSKSFATTPTVLQTFTNSGTPGSYDDILAGVTVNQTNGTIYYGIENDGTFAIPNSQAGGPVMADQYAISGHGAKALSVDANGNVYVVVYGSGTTVAGTAFTGKDTAGQILLGDLTVPNAQYDGAPVTASATLVDNGILFCPTPAATLAFAFSGADASEFSATQGTGCTSSIGVGDGTLSSSNSLTGYGSSSYPVTVTFAATVPNSSTATMTATDTTNGGEGTATVTGFGLTTPQTISFTSPANNSSYTYTAPPAQVTITLQVANGGSNFPVAFSVDPSSTGAGTLSATTVTGTNSSATLTVTQAGTILIDATEPSGLATNHVYYNTSNTATLTLAVGQAVQAITFTPVTPGTYTYSASPQVTVPLSATGGASGNPVTFSVDKSSSGAGTVSATSVVGNASFATLTITQAGSIVLDANQAATVDYAAAPQVQQTITANPASQTITFVPPTAAIHFISPSSGVTGGVTVAVSAIGGGSDNPIVFTVDKSSTMTGSFGASTVSGATSTATLTIPVQGSVVSGSIVIDATQPASTDYAAVTVAPLGTITILPPLPTQLITFNNPGTQVVGTALTLAATASSGLPVSYVSTSTTVCTVSGSSVTFAASVTSASNCTLVASQPGDNINWAAAPSITQTFTVNPKGQSPNIAIDLSLSSVTIQAGTVGLTNLAITSQNNFTGALTLACTGLPAGYGCSFNPSTINISEGGTASTTLTISPPANAALVRHNTRPLIPMTAVAVALCFIGFRKRSRLQLLLLLGLGLAALGMFSGCGGSKGNGPGAPGITGTSSGPVTSTASVTVSASGMAGASGAVQQTLTLTVTVDSSN